MNWFQYIVAGLAVITALGFIAMYPYVHKKKVSTIKYITTHLPFAIVCAVFLLMAFYMGEVV